MNLYGIVRFYTSFSGRLMGEGSIFKLEPAESDMIYCLGKPLITDRVIQLGLVSKERLSEIRIPNTSLIIEDPAKDTDEKYEIRVFSETSDENVKLLVDIKGMEGVWKL